MDKRAKDKLAGSPGDNGGVQDAQKDLFSRTGRDEMKRKTQEMMERRSRKKSLSVGSEKIDRVGDKWGKMERYCSTGQSPQRAVAPMEEEEGESCNNRSLLAHAKENCQNNVAGTATVYVLVGPGLKSLWWRNFCCRPDRF